ncbi:hypothetical protein HYALB_00009057 [Hymenoscyphus albidus]|uniref:Uncharacterized protein n=1 Tax=Hymenoscyphus albidus TaxID=595503 RepID=A0A9N9Q4J7_9HELO|nr:hypothetical protein HYALB_00009057 [Hymenoscyphus albidus]
MQKGHDPVSIKALQVFLFTSLICSFVTSAISIPIKIQIRALGIDLSPAPSPENGPPFSAGATRDRSLLPAQIGGIIGAYLFSVCIIGLALIFCGRKARRALQQPGIVLDVEMVQPHKQLSIDPSPISPTRGPGSPRNFSWPSPEKDERNPYVFPPVNRSPITPPGTDPYVDSRVVQQDRDMAARNLEDIYAHVMEQEEAKAAGLSPKEMPPPAPLQRPGSIPAPAPQKGSRRPSAITIDGNKSTRSRASSILSVLKSPRRKQNRPLQISSPLPTPMSATFPRDGGSDTEPLSPKYYKPPPPIPTDQVPYTDSRNTSNITPTSPTRSIAEQMAPYGPGGSGNSRHRQYPSQASAHSYDPGSASTTTSQTPLNPPPTKKAIPHPIPTASNPTNAHTRALPFRQFEPALQSPSFKPATKTTVLERKGPQHSGPMTGGLRTAPWSPGAVPYSPFYQPMTPMIPVTPTLVTRQDRKMMKKQQKKAPVQELVSDDMWDSGY